MRTELPNLELIQERFYNHIKPELGDLRYPQFEVNVFLQTWGSTSLGFGGIGGQAMISAYTTVIWEDNTGIYGVFFGEGLAYVIKNPNDVLWRACRAIECLSALEAGRIGEINKLIFYMNLER